MDITPETTLLALLSEGASITLPNQVILKGDPENQCLDVGFIGFKGEWVPELTCTLDEQGLERAIEDAHTIAQDIAGI